MESGENTTKSIDETIDVEFNESYVVGMAGIYKEIAKNFDISIAIKMHKYYQGQQISFPTKLFSSDYLADMITRDYIAGASVKELSKKYGYSERRVRQIIKGNNIT